MIGCALSGLGVFRALYVCLALFVLLGLSSCQGTADSTLPEPPRGGQGLGSNSGSEHVTFPAPDAWGGEARCMVDGCKVIYVEHEAGQLVLRRFQDGNSAELSRHPLAYHPDSAKWLSDDWVVAAVEAGRTLDFFRIQDDRLIRHSQVEVPFAPRDVVVLAVTQDAFTLVATPYAGKQVAIVEWQLGRKEAKVTPVDWCEEPWHPARVTHAPRGGGAGAVVACRRDFKLLYVDAKNWAAAPIELADLGTVARQARPSPSGKWVYVAQEIGGRNSRVNMETGELQRLTAPHVPGNVSVLPLSDDMVLWGGATSLAIQRMDADGKALQTRWLRASGFPTNLQVLDLNGDGELDLLVLSSSGELADVYFGPLWDRALENL